MCVLSCFSTIPWNVACQAPLCIWFSRQEYWSGLPCPSLGDLPNPGFEPRSLAFQADSLLSEPPGKPLICFKWLSHAQSRVNFLTPFSSAAAAKSHQLCLTLCEPIAYQAPLSLGFSMQEHWSGLPFPSVHESEKWKWSRSVVSDP